MVGEQVDLLLAQSAFGPGKQNDALAGAGEIGKPGFGAGVEQQTQALRHRGQVVAQTGRCQYFGYSVASGLFTGRVGDTLPVTLALD